MSRLTLTTNKTKAALAHFFSDPVTTFIKENWRDIATVAAVALIVEDVDTAADILTATTEGVIS